MENLYQELKDVLSKIKAAQNAAGRSEKGRLLAIAATNTETACLYLKEADEWERGEEYAADGAINERKSNPPQD